MSDYSEVESETEYRWGTVVAASGATALPTLVGLLVLVPRCGWLAGAPLTGLTAGASGVLFAAAVFLMLPEAFALIGAVTDGEASSAAAWGTPVILGWLLCAVVGHAVQLRCPVPEDDEDVKVQDAKGVVPATTTQNGVRWHVALPVFIGDWFHNFVDGVFVGIAFRHCDENFGWTVAGTAVAHELPQEISDFGILVSRANMSVRSAVAFNLLSGLASVLGALLGHGVELSQQATGGMLAFGGGVYLYLALTECGPEVAQTKTLRSSLTRLASFAVGAALIGLVLLDHEHCAAGGDHEGHNH